MTPIETDKHVFFDDSGELLSNGEIYIGQPDTDPRTNKKTVRFEDSAGGQFIAQQPLRTINGKISYNGKPIKALVDGEYSMLILDSSGKQVDYSSSITPPDSGGSSGTSFGELIRVGPTLDDIKEFDVSVGDAVRNNGETDANDGNGADWIAVSNTGTSGNDVDLIDFDNGLQGRLNESFVYPQTPLEWRDQIFRFEECHATFSSAGVLQSSIDSDSGVSISMNSASGGGFYTIGLSSTVEIVSITAIPIAGPPQAQGWNLSGASGNPTPDVGASLDAFNIVFRSDSGSGQDTKFSIHVRFKR